MRSLVVTLLLLLGLCSNSFAQKEHNVWHFGERAGIDFNTTPPTGILTQLPQANEGSASICDGITGAFLFSTNGNYIYNRDGKPMKGFNGLRVEEGNSSTQAALIIPFAKDVNKYFVFFADQCGYIRPNEGVAYVIVDMRGDNGLGEVISSPVALLGGMTEKLTAIPHANGCDVWMISHRQTTNEYLTTLIRDSAVSTIPVVSAIGHVPQPGTFGEEGGIGWLVASQQGDRLAYVTTTGRLELLRFDRTTGIVSDVFGFEVEQGIYGACFSPDGTKLYVSGTTDASALQYDISLDNSQIESSSERIGKLNVGAIRPMPDGKLYCVSALSAGLGVINDPNAKGQACDYQPDAITYASGSYASIGLPNIPDAYIGKSMRPCLPPPLAKPVGILAAKTSVCEGDCFDISAVDADGRALVWHFSDGREIANQNDPHICFDDPGSYGATVLAIDNNGDTAKSSVTLTVMPAIELSLRPYTITTDTIGVTVKVPIVVSEKITANFDAEFVYDPSLLDYVGAFDKAGNRLDVGQTTPGAISIRKQVSNDSVVGYLYFDLYWESEKCRTVQLVSSAVTTSEPRCLSSGVTEYQLCLEDFCGERTISDRMRDSMTTLKVMYDRNSDAITLRSSIDAGQSTVTIFDATGKLAEQSPTLLHSNESVKIDASNLPQGAYHLRVSNTSGTYYKNVLIVR